jgi:hypothetical protein
MTDPIVELNLSVLESEGRLLATLRYRNTGERVAFIDLINGCIREGELRNNIFVIEPLTAQGTMAPKLAYRGRRVKRRKPILPDFFRLEPGATTEGHARLDQSYAFLAGQHRYKIAYSAVHQFPENDDYWELASNQVEVTFPK